MPSTPPLGTQREAYQPLSTKETDREYLIGVLNEIYMDQVLEAPPINLHLRPGEQEYPIKEFIHILCSDLDADQMDEIYRTLDPNTVVKVEKIYALVFVYSFSLKKPDHVDRISMHAPEKMTRQLFTQRNMQKQTALHLAIRYDHKFLYSIWELSSIELKREVCGDRNYLFPLLENILLTRGDDAYDFFVNVYFCAPLALKREFYEDTYFAKRLLLLATVEERVNFVGFLLACCPKDLLPQILEVGNSTNLLNRVIWSNNPDLIKVVAPYYASSSR